MKICLILAFFASALSVGAAAQSTPQSVKGEEVGLNVQRYHGKRVMIEDCIMFNARLDGAGCPIFVGSNIAGAFRVQYSKADPEGRKSAIANCNETAPKERCVARIVATVRRTAVPDVVGLDDAVIYWTRR